MLEVLMAFTLSVGADPMTDEETYSAYLGGDRAGISVFCGPGSDGELAVNFLTPRRVGRSFNRTKVEWRFDDGKSNTAYGRSDARKVSLTGYQAKGFVAKVQLAQRIRLRIEAANDEPILMDAQITERTGAIDEVIAFCKNR